MKLLRNWLLNDWGLMWFLFTFNINVLYSSIKKGINCIQNLFFLNIYTCKSILPNNFQSLSSAHRPPPPLLLTFHFLAFCYMYVFLIYFKCQLTIDVILMLVISKVFLFHIQYDQISLSYFIYHIIFIRCSKLLGIPSGVQ